MRPISLPLVICLAFLGLSGRAIAGGHAGISADAHVESKGEGEVISFSGSFRGFGKAKARAIVVLKSAISNKVLDQTECKAPEGSFHGEFGPYEKPFWPQTYVLIISAAVSLDNGGPDNEGRVAASMGAGPAINDRKVLVPVHVTASVDAQREEQSTRFRDAILLIRTLFLEVEHQVPALKASYATDPEKTGKAFDAWWKKWDERQRGLAQTFADRSYLDYWGNPFVTEYAALTISTDQLRKYAERAVINISGEEKMDPRDRGKDFGTLQSEGKLPSRILREQFLYALANAFETLELPNPNAALVEAATTEIAEAFLAIRSAFHSGGMAPNGSEMKKYRDYLERVRLLEEDLSYFFKGRKNVLPGERTLQERVMALDGYISRLGDLEQKYTAQKSGGLGMEEVQKAELSLALDLVSGSLVMSVPALQQAYNCVWGIYESMVQSLLSPQAPDAPDTQDPEYVRKTFDPTMERVDKLLASAHTFLTSVGENEPGIGPVVELVRDAEARAVALRKLVASCEALESTEGKSRTSACEAVQSRAKQLQDDLGKLQGKMNEVFAAPK